MHNLARKHPDVLVAGLGIATSRRETFQFTASRAHPWALTLVSLDAGRKPSGAFRPAKSAPCMPRPQGPQQNHQVPCQQGLYPFSTHRRPLGQ
jgi:hypothetical protein